jgi:hypothetical protein
MIASPQTAAALDVSTGKCGSWTYLARCSSNSNMQPVRMEKRPGSAVRLRQAPFQAPGCSPQTLKLHSRSFSWFVFYAVLLSASSICAWESEGLRPFSPSRHLPTLFVKVVFLQHIDSTEHSHLCQLSVHLPYASDLFSSASNLH